MEHIALDTEFVWQRTYYANLGLIQAAPSAGLDRARLPRTAPHAMPFETDVETRRNAVLIDPLRCPPRMLADVVADSSVVKILHDAVQDLQHIARWCGASPVNVFDTRIAAGFCGMPSTCSLRWLLAETQGIDLPKTETRTNWLQRPLSQEQLEYAADDVVHLGVTAEMLVEKARRLGTFDWMMEEMRLLDDPALYAEDPVEDAWRRVKVPVREFTEPEKLLRLRELARWREEVARGRNLPRSWVVEDKVLVGAALRPPAKEADIPKKDLPRPFAAGFFRTLSAAAAMPHENLPELNSTATVEERETATRMMAAVAEVAKKLNVDAALFGSRADYVAYSRSPGDPAHKLSSGWRRAALGNLLDLING